MPAFRADIVVFKQIGLVVHRIEIALHNCIIRIVTPPHKMVNGTLRTICVIYLEPVTLRDNIIAYGFERVGSLASEQSGRCEITVNARSDKIVGTVIADFKDGIRNNIGYIDEVVATVVILLFLTRSEKDENKEK